MAKKSGKGPRVTIKMSSTESPYRFTTTKNKRNHPQRLELRRYDPVLRRHVRLPACSHGHQHPAVAT